MTSEERELKTAQMSALEATAVGCSACALCEKRTNVVFGVGNAGSPLMVIGEGPGQNEDEKGEPFVGKAGQLLDQCLYAAGLIRKHVYITNIVKCRPTVLSNGRLNNRPPTPDESAVCVPLWLEKQIEIIKPRVILCLGSPSANAVIHKGFKITQERGSFFETKYVKYAIAAFHPSYILRQQGPGFGAVKQTLIDDIVAAKNKAIETKGEQ